jgi:hypothetical protein
MALRSLFYFVLLSAILIVAMRWPSPSMVLVAALVVLVSYLVAFVGFATGRSKERLCKGGYLFGGVAYSCLVGMTNGVYSRANLNGPFVKLYGLIHPSDPLSQGANLLGLFGFAQPAVADFISICHLATSALASIVCYWSLFAYARRRAIDDLS